MEHYSAIKVIHLPISMDEPKIVMLNKRSQTKNTYCVILFPCNYRECRQKSIYSKLWFFQ